ncbi:hypothetical protein COX85_01850 [Candidatus Micrarchaeota archaeon CG_4_10_14_0_2_um_filter_55_9]|nr:MAG: hypothetical protein AUJ15_03960 [Candidatus Micrarchaeota archaeon CG1_02_55_41]PIO02764.1 MAG: hypothetical protein COT57_02395 [Candidatus Micrarchaeota archaeon CG09_land_8_20_14_0_10_55_25]PIZ91821.1 MAG: hypothetical protein COX85_01850 [Candidatus Micrarchaeota archaeon CG_4_10_14_0_2_um_filter_55_9]PJD00916.1 MAG: hypothetical protein COU38_03850 [Candidatus Micrarchaeota archaeon CG10_big_fil_rev_8_21_14_0_10_54_18]
MNILLDRESFKALANGTRVELLKKLGGRRATASELSKSLGISVQAAGKHLKKMRCAGLVNEERRSKWVYYSLTDKGAALLNPQPQKNLWILLGISLLAFAYASQLFLGSTPSPQVAEKVLGEEASNYALDAVAATPIEPTMDYASVAALVIGSICLGAFLYALLREKRCVC